MTTCVAELVRKVFEGEATPDQVADALRGLGHVDAEVVRVLQNPIEIAQLLVGNALTLVEILALPIDCQTKLSLVLNRDRMDDRVFGELACDFAEHVLPIFEAWNSYDSRPRDAIESCRAWWNGGASKQELYKACHATMYSAKAARKTNPKAAYAANAAGAASDGGGDAVDASYYAVLAGGDDELRWQVERVLVVLGDAQV